jgi:hypothetical protein
MGEGGTKTFSCAPTDTWSGDPRGSSKKSRGARSIGGTPGSPGGKRWRDRPHAESPRRMRSWPSFLLRTARWQSSSSRSVSAWKAGRNAGESAKCTRRRPAERDREAARSRSRRSSDSGSRGTPACRPRPGSGGGPQSPRRCPAPGDSSSHCRPRTDGCERSPREARPRCGARSRLVCVVGVLEERRHHPNPLSSEEQTHRGPASDA